MSHLEEQQCDPHLKNMSKKKTQKTMSLVDYISDPKRNESLIGLRYVVEIKMLESDKSIIKCNMCGVKGLMSTMKEHLSGANHIKVYMERHYLSVLQSLKRSCQHKSQLAKLIKDYAKEIERAEGTQRVKIEYVSAADMKKEQENWIAEQKEKSEFCADQKKLQVLDKRQVALNYSETFKILSREEATIVLNLTQQLSDQLEQYFLKSKGLDFLHSTIPNSISTKSTPGQKDLPPILYENIHPISAPDLGLNKETQWHAEEPSSSSIYWCDRVPEDTRGMKRKPEMPKDVSHECDVRPESSCASEFQDRKKRHQEHDNCPTMHSSSYFYMNDMGLPQYRSAEVSSSYPSSIAATYTHISVPEMFGGELQMVKDTPPYRVSQNSLNDNISRIETVQETESPNDSDTAETSNVDAVPGLSSSTSDSSCEPSSEKPSSSHSHGKTSKTLSPDILQLLKGKDANTVTNILRTLSPFYPALQEVNLEILAQVLVNTGVLD